MAILTARTRLIIDGYHTHLLLLHYLGIEERTGSNRVVSVTYCKGGEMLPRLDNSAATVSWNMISAKFSCLRLPLPGSRTLQNSRHAQGPSCQERKARRVYVMWELPMRLWRFDTPETIFSTAGHTYYHDQEWYCAVFRKRASALNSNHSMWNECFLNPP